MTRSSVLLPVLSWLALAAWPLASHATVPVVDAVGKAALIKCGSNAAGAAVNAVHADKIIFRLTGFLPARDDADQVQLNQVPRNTELDIKVLDNPRSVADLRGKVLTFLGAADTPDARLNVNIIDVDYAMVCPAAN
jgi:hypothetical protein